MDDRKEWMLLAKARGNIIRNAIGELNGVYINCEDEDILREFMRLLRPLGLKRLFENEFGNLNCKDPNVILVVKAAIRCDYPDFNTYEAVTDEFCKQYYEWLKHDDSLLYFFNCITHMDYPDFV